MSEVQADRGDTIRFSEIDGVTGAGVVKDVGIRGVHVSLTRVQAGCDVALGETWYVPFRLITANLGPAAKPGFGYPDQEPAEVEAEAKAREAHAKRKGQPLARGVLYYAPDALAYVAEVSVAGNDQHNPGEPLHWAKEKSTDHGDCIVRHQADYDELDTDGKLHAGKVAWRALMQLQTLLESRDPALAALRQAQRDRQAKGER